MTATFKITQGDCLSIMRSMPSASVDAVITDPPYCSGGASSASRMLDPGKKYMTNGQTRVWPEFGGDNKDQRGYFAWCNLWMSECRRILKPNGYFLTFTDWRQLPVTTDAVQSADIVWRGLIAWNKGLGARAPHKGYFKHQCEYIVWGTRDGCHKAEHDGPFPGCYQATVLQRDKFHMTGKPSALMRELVKIVPPGSTIFDPFMGSGSTGVGAMSEGRNFIGIEREEFYFGAAHDRLTKLGMGLSVIAENEWEARIDVG